MTEALRILLEQMRPAFGQDRLFERANSLMFSSLLCLGQHTITGLLSTCGQQFVDWSAAYRLFEKERFDADKLFDPLRRHAATLIDPAAPIVSLLDDTLLRKRGRHVHGATWKRDPLGPPFQTNLVWSQRFLQTSIAVPERFPNVPGRARAVPIDLRHCPTARKPSKKAPDEEWKQFRDLRKTQRISVIGAEQVQKLRTSLNHDPATTQRPLVICVDGSFTNRQMFSNLPDNTTLIGRIRKDAKLHAPPTEEQRQKVGRTLVYGKQLPTPEQIRQDDTIPWKKIKVFIAGQMADVDIKVVSHVLWQPAGKDHPLQLIVIRPLAYRPSKNARPLYRDPAYLICSSLELDVQQIVQWFLWRWEIELNFRDEKTLLGVGEAQVRTEAAVESVPQMQVAAYAALLLASQDVQSKDRLVPKPAWQNGHRNREERFTTTDMIKQLRAELWGEALGVKSFSGFTNARCADIKPVKLENTLADAVFFACR